MGCVYRDRRSTNVVWGIRYRDVDGRARWERTKASTKTLARRILSQREDDVERAKLQGLSSVMALIAPAPSVNLRQYAQEYMTHVRAHCSTETARRYESQLRANILPALGSMTLREVNAGHVQKYADDRLKSASPATVRHEMMLLSGVFKAAIRRELVDRNPVHNTDKPRVDNVIVRYLDRAEEDRLMAYAREPVRSAIIVAIHTGLREGEQLNIKWTDVRFHERVIVVRQTKSKRDRIVPMSRTLYETLQKIPRHIGSPYVFTNPETGTRYSHFNGSSSLWRATLKKAGIENLRWHDLRHTFGSRLAQAGVSIVTIKELLGHSAIQVTMRYAHMAPSNLRAAVQALDQEVAAVADAAKAV